MERHGKCRWCGCSYFEPCPQGCGWANATQTLCTACVGVDREWSHLTTRRPNMRRAFFRGFMMGSQDARGEHGLLTAAAAARLRVNPYDTAAQRRWWQLGFDAGAKEAR